MMWVLLSLIGLLLTLVAYLGLLYGDWSRRVREEEKADHAKCMALVASAVSDRMVAQNLRAMADKYDSMEEMPTRDRIRRTHDPDGLSVPAMWMKHQADLLDPSPKDNRYNLYGERPL